MGFDKPCKSEHFWGVHGMSKGSLWLGKWSYCVSGTCSGYKGAGPEGEQRCLPALFSTFSHHICFLSCDGVFCWFFLPNKSQDFNCPANKTFAIGQQSYLGFYFSRFPHQLASYLRSRFSWKHIFLCTSNFFYCIFKQLYFSILLKVFTLSIPCREVFLNLF